VFFAKKKKGGKGNTNPPQYQLGKRRNRKMHKSCKEDASGNPWTARSCCWATKEWVDIGYSISGRKGGRNEGIAEERKREKKARSIGSEKKFRTL